MNASSAPRCPLRPAISFTTLLLRFSLGGLMAFSGWMKLGLHTDLGLQAFLPLKSLAPLDFYFAIAGFKLGLPEHLGIALSFIIPWTELLAGLGLIFGLWTRAAALIIALTMAGFAAGILSVISRGLDVNCPCFGAIKLFCPSRIGTCHIIRNAAFASAAIWIIVTDAGPLSLDRLLARQRS